MSRPRAVSITLCLLCAALFANACKQRAAPTTVPTTAPATTPTTQVTQRPPPKDYLDVVRVNYPRVATTQPLDMPLSLLDAGHFILKKPVFLCSQDHLWITHPEGPPIEEVLKSAAAQQTHVSRERVLFVHWTRDEKGD